MQQSTETEWDLHFKSVGKTEEDDIVVKVTDREITVVAAMFIVSVLIAAGSLYWLLA